MDRLTELLEMAASRATELKLPYAGALTPREASEILGLDSDAKLIDVRTKAEWDWVGRIPGAIEIEFMSYPYNALNALFMHMLEGVAAKDSLLFFICRSGGRSHAVANTLAAAGFGRCYNVLEGFEGDKDSNSQRNRIGGWRAAGLPWYQS